jgi:serine/threonine protein kinase
MSQKALSTDPAPFGLPAGTRLLNGQYEILGPLQQGGFGITYLARDSLHRTVVVKECFPADLCRRSGVTVRPDSRAHRAPYATLIQQFLREARRLARLRHPNIVAVHQVFEENGTAYMALDFVPGDDLVTLLEDDAARLTPALLDSALRQGLQALAYIHANDMLHRDIAPDNLRIDDLGHVTLIDFGAARERLNQGEADPAPALIAVKDGYSPPEFYDPAGHHDFASDIYSLGASFYHLITGIAPPSAPERAEALAAGAADPYVPLAQDTWACPYPVLLTVDHALSLDPAERFDTAADWDAALDAAPRVRPAPVAPPAHVEGVALDPALAAEVARLVRETNREVTPGAPAAIVRRPPPGPEKPKKRQLVDLFGNPVRDVDRWLREQERERHVPEPQSIAPQSAAPHPQPGDTEPTAQARQSHRVQPKPLPGAETPAQNAPRRSLFATLFGRRARDSDTRLA